jgi:hypothetical protein
MNNLSSKSSAVKKALLFLSSKYAAKMTGFFLWAFIQAGLLPPE